MVSEAGADRSLHTGRRLYTGPNTYVQSSGGTYCASLYIVRACNAGGCSAWSADFPVTRGLLNWD